MGINDIFDVLIFVNPPLVQYYNIWVDFDKIIKEIPEFVFVVMCVENFVHNSLILCFVYL